VIGDESADNCIRADIHKTDRQTTPDALKKFRKSQNDKPGQKQTHPGLYNDPAYKPADHSYGKHTYDSEHVDRVIKAQNLAGLADKFNDIKEGKYHSAVREPLGKSFLRVY
jgi:hypothetical protein